MNRLIHSDKDSWVYLIYHDLSEYSKIPKMSPVAYIFRRPYLRGLCLEGLIYGVKFVFQNRLV